MSARWAWLLAASCAGCGGGVVEVALPVTPGTRALLVGVRHEERLSVYAVDAEAAPDTWTLPGVPALRGGEARLLALLYDQPLAELGRAPGLLVQDPRGEPPPDAAEGTFELTVAEGKAGTWTPVGAPSSDLAFRLPRRPLDQRHCRTLDVEVQTFDEPGRVLVMFPEPGGGLLAINVHGTAYRVDEDGAAPIRLGPTGVDTAFAGARTSTGAIWLAGYGHDLRSGTLEAGFTRRPGAPEVDTARWMVAPPTGDTPPELFFLGRGGILHRLSADGWRRTDLVLSNGSDHQGALMWTGPDEVAAISPLTGVLSYVRGGVPEHVGIHTTRGTLLAMARLEGQLYGLTDLGLIVRFLGLEYVEETFIEDASASNTLSPLGGGLLVGARGLRLFHHIPGQDPCPLMGPLAPDHEIWAAVTAGDVAYLTTGHPEDWDDEPARLVKVRLR
jgi:hypothetical protein